MEQEPIACSLGAADAAERGGEWRRQLATAVESIARQPGSARLLLRQDDSALLAAVDLAEREMKCCGFFSFSVALAGSRRWLVVECPDAAEPILSALVG